MKKYHFSKNKQLPLFIIIGLVVMSLLFSMLQKTPLQQFGSIFIKQPSFKPQTLPKTYEYIQKAAVQPVRQTATSPAFKATQQSTPKKISICSKPKKKIASPQPKGTKVICIPYHKASKETVEAFVAQGVDKHFFTHRTVQGNSGKKICFVKYPKRTLSCSKNLKASSKTFKSAQTGTYCETTNGIATKDKDLLKHAISVATIEEAQKYLQ